MAGPLNLRPGKKVNVLRSVNYVPVPDDKKVPRVVTQNELPEARALQVSGMVYFCIDVSCAYYHPWASNQCEAKCVVVQYGSSPPILYN